MLSPCSQGPAGCRVAEQHDVRSVIIIIINMLNQGLISVGTVGNAAPILIFRWERSSYSVPSLYPLGLPGAAK